MRNITSNRHQETVNKYEGGNELLDRLIEDEEVWIVNGAVGRFPIIANSREEALDRYGELLEEHKNRLGSTLNHGDNNG
jgi:hypothetical protein